MKQSDLIVAITVDDKGTPHIRKLKNEVEGLSKSTNKTTSVFQKLNQGFLSTKVSAQGLRSAFFAVSGVVTALIVAYKQLTNVLVESDSAERRLDIIMRNVTKAADSQIIGIKQLASQLQETTTLTDEAVMSGASQLATFKLTTEQIRILLPAMSDLAVGTYGAKVTQDQMVQSANMVGRVLEGNVGALTRVGISLSDVQKELIKNGDQMQRVATIAEVLKDNYGGLATEMKESIEGTLNETSKAWGDFWEDLSKHNRGLVGEVATFVRNSALSWRNILGLDDFKNALLISEEQFQQIGEALVKSGKKTKQEYDEIYQIFVDFSEKFRKGDKTLLPTMTKTMLEWRKAFRDLQEEEAATEQKRARAAEAEIKRKERMKEANAAYVESIKQGGQGIIDLMPSIQAAEEEAARKTQELMDRIKGYALTIADGMSSSMAALINGQKEWARAFAESVKNVVLNVLTMLESAAMGQALKRGFPAAIPEMLWIAAKFEVLKGIVKAVKFAEGGLVDSPTLALLGEAGQREFVTPETTFEKKWRSFEEGLLKRLDKSGGGETPTYVINMPLPISSTHEIAKEVIELIDKEQRHRARLTPGAIR